jgi:tRNA(Ile)-lysidine synthase
VAKKAERSSLTLAREMFRPGERVCAAVSGGADSVALLRSLVAANAEERGGLGVGLSAVHVHHGLRGAAADGDLQFVRGLCGRLGVVLHERRVDVAGRIELERETLEEAARNLRYGVFRELMASGEADVVATAHTLDDQAETVLMKLLRGAWTEGLGGISPVVEQGTARVVRPLLGIRRCEIEDYLRNEGQEWREDASNRDVAHMRNRIRHELLPVLREYNPEVVRALGNLAEIARGEEERWRGELARILPQVLLPGKPARGGGRAAGTDECLAVELERLRGMDRAMQRRVVRAGARELGVAMSFEETERVLLLGAQGASGGKLELHGGLRVERTLRELRFHRA